MYNMITDNNIKLPNKNKDRIREPSILWLRNRLKRTSKVRVLEEIITTFLSRRIKNCDIYDKFSKLDGVTLEVKVSEDKNRCTRLHLIRQQKNNKSWLALGKQPMITYSKIKESPEDFLFSLLSQVDSQKNEIFSD